MLRTTISSSSVKPECPRRRCPPHLDLPQDCGSSQTIIRLRQDVFDRQPELFAPRSNLPVLVFRSVQPRAKRLGIDVKQVLPAKGI
jgi:hypothetical protein